MGIAVVRGSTNDVLARFVEAVSNDTCDAVVRVCADNPFIDPACVDAAITAYRTEAVDYAFNHRPHGSCNYADGFGAEVVSRALLERLNATQLSAPHREHVTLAVIDGVVQANIHACIAPSSLARPDLRFDVDHPEDLVRLRALVSNGGVTPIPHCRGGWRRPTCAAPLVHHESSVFAIRTQGGNQSITQARSGGTQRPL